MLQLPIREKDNVMLLFPPYCEMAHGLVQEQQSISQRRQKKRDECRLQEGTDLFPLIQNIIQQFFKTVTQHLSQHIGLLAI